MSQTHTDKATEPQVDSYQKVASLGGWAGGGRTLWAIAGFGAVVGAAMGAVAPFFPLLVGASSLSTAMGAVAASVASFAAVGMGIGFSGGVVLGRISGSAAAVGEEQERRMKRWTAAQLKQVDGHYQPVSVPEAPEETTEPTLKDTYETYINPKIGLAMAAIGAVGGLMLAAANYYTGGTLGSVMPVSIGQLTGMLTPEEIAQGAQVSTKVMTAYTVGVMSTFGALWSFNFPKITSNITEFSGRLTGGKIIGRTWEPQREKQVEVAAEPASPLSEQSCDPLESSKPSSHFADKETPPKGYEQMVLDRQLSAAQRQVQ